MSSRTSRITHNGGQKALGLVPSLRFPEFEITGSWQIKTLSQIATLLKGKGISKSDIDPKGKTPCIRYGELYTHYSEIITEVVSKTNVAPHELVFSEANDVVIPSSGETKSDIAKASCVLNSGVALGGDLNVIRPFANGAFLSYCLNGPIKSEISRVAQGDTVVHLYLSQLETLTVSVPTPDEQRKIAECLSSVDELIAAEGRKLEALKAHKKGLMQQLFPAEGETTPRLRFFEFRTGKRWKERRLGDMGDVLMCKRIFANETNPTEGVPFYKIGTLGGSADAFISRDLFQEYKERYNYPRQGEVLITCSGTVGKCLPFDGKDAYFQDSNIVWIDNPTLEVSNQFLLSVLSSVNWGSLNSTTITRIYGPDLRGLSIKYPQDQLERVS